MNRRTALELGGIGLVSLAAAACGNSERVIEEWSKVQEVTAFRRGLRRSLRNGSTVQILDGHLILPAGTEIFLALDDNLNPVYPRTKNKDAVLHTPIIIPGSARGAERLVFAEASGGRIGVVSLEQQGGIIRPVNSPDSLAGIPRDEVKAVSEWRFDHGLKGYGAYHEGRQDERGRSHRVRFAYSD